MAQARRATMWRGDDGLWRFKVQAMNWATIDSSQIGAKRRTVERIIERRYPGIEIIVVT